MPSIRIGFSSDFVLKNGVVGLGTTVGSTTDGKLELDNGVLRANFSVTGVATLTAYGGFVAQNQHVNKPAAIGFATVGVGTFQQYYETTTEFTDLGGVHHGDDQYFNTLSEDLVIDDGQILNITNTDMVGVTTIGEYDPHNHSSYVCAGSLEQVSVTGHFSVPHGGINDRKDNPIEGTVRFNTDLSTLEFFNGNEWRQFTYNQGQSGRGLFAGGADPAAIATIQKVQISTRGNAQDFGDLTVSRYLSTGCASPTRGVFAGGYTNGYTDIIDYVTTAAGGTAADFGDLASASGYMGSFSSSTRGITTNEYTPTLSNKIQYVEIGTKGNAIDFGDLTQRKSACSSGSTGTRAVWAGGYLNISPLLEHYKTIEYITIASGGNGIDFGERTFAGAYSGAASSHTRLVTCMGFTPSATNRMDSIEMNTGGEAVQFGDAVTTANAPGGCSDSHGGLGGF